MHTLSMLISWLSSLFADKSSSAVQLLIICLVIALGVVIGSIKFFNINIGIAGALFSGLLFGHFHLGANPVILEFARDFGLVLFVYTIGIQVGPGFLASLRTQGWRLNSCAIAIVLLGSGITVALHFLTKVSAPAAVGMLAGATTNTPSLAAAGTTLQGLSAYTYELGKIPALAYAVAYPFGIFGIILTMIFIRTIFKIVIKEESQETSLSSTELTLNTLNVEITNENFVNHAIGEIPIIRDSQIIVSRLYHNGTMKIAHPEDKLQLGDIILLIGHQQEINDVQAILGKQSTIDLKAIRSNLIVKKMFVTKDHVINKPIKSLQFLEKYDVTISRVIRSGIELVPNHDLKLHFGDIILVIGDHKALEQMAHQVGNSVKDLYVPQVLPIFIAISLGIILGQLPIPIPGVPAPLKLGIAGGPLVSAILFSWIRSIGKLIWFMPSNVNLTIREIGILLFLGCVGLKAGDRFYELLTQGDGLYWMGLATLITAIPLLIVGPFAYKVLKIDYPTVCGILAGSMTDPPALAFAAQMTGSPNVTVAYATVYPITMLMRIFLIQLLLLFLMG